MSKPKRLGSGFSSPPKNQATKKNTAQRAADHSTKEQKAISLINEGNLPEAEIIYRSLIEEGTTNHIVYANLAAIRKLQGKSEGVIELLNKAIYLEPNLPEAHNNLGVTLKESGETDAAINSYNNALSLDPTYPDAHNNLGNALKEKGDIDAAIDSYTNAIQHKMNYPEAHNNLGTCLKEQGELDAAIACYQNAIQLQPNYPDAHNNLGNAFKEQGDLTAAIASYNMALKIKPKCSFYHKRLGVLHHERGDMQAAVSSYKCAIELNPHDSETHNNLGIALKELGQPQAAITEYQSALELQPNDPEVHSNLGNALKELGDLNAAISSYKKALELKPNDPEACYNLGTVLGELGELTEAIKFFNKSLELKPNYPEAHWNSSLARLLSGDYKKGWDQYEWREKIPESNSVPHAQPKCSQWDGSRLERKSQILLVSEQGLGDTLQFMRYTVALKNQGYSVSICAQPKLHTLIQVSGIDPSPLTSKQANQVCDGQWIPLLSVPKYLEISPQNPIITEPYIKPTDELSAKWNEILSTEDQPIVGINWQGNPRVEKTVLRGRSLPLESFAPIAHQTKTSLLSLQKGYGSEQLEDCSFKDCFVSCQDQINEASDFSETAAIIANCDLVITSDTSVAHLAGGMGKTTWLLLHKVPDWRWGLEGDTTFWYPTMRLFRQRERGNWNEVMERVAEALKEHFGGISTPAEPARAPQPSINPEPIQDIQAPISLGELIDKITILQIKTKHLQGAGLENVNKELEALETTLNSLKLNIDATFIQRLKEVNQDLWQIEDDIRDQERRKNFGETFIRLARSVYQQNDRRAAIKKEINTTYDSALVEEKSYQDY